MILRHRARWPLAATAVVLAAAVAFAALRALAPAARADSDGHPIVALHGLQVSVFARGGTAQTRPDTIVTWRDRVFVGYQNATAADGSDGTSSTIVEYSAGGRELRHWSVLGRNDGLRLDSATHLLWATVNEDANSSLYTINPDTGQVAQYTWSSAAHGGGYDDLAFTGGKAFVAASNPTLGSDGVNHGPALLEVQLQGTVAQVTPVLAGDATAVDTTTGSTVTLNLTDPDSLTLDPAGDLVLVSQADSEIVYVAHPGSPQQSVRRTPVGTQLDDTAWVTSAESRLYVADTAQNAIYRIDADFQAGAVYTEAPSDSGVASWVGTLDPKSGSETPVAIGFGSPSGLVFGPQGG